MAKYKDLTGLRIGKLTVVEPTDQRVRSAVVWRCRCDCGNEIETTKRRLVTGNTTSCGCGKTPPLKDWVGKRFGMLTVLSYARKEKGFHMWHCRCDCGREVDVRQSNLQSGWTKSCGDCGREVDVRQSNLQSGWTKSCGCQRDPGRNLHYKDGTCLELLRPDLMYRTNTSGVKGVYYSKTRGKWIAQIMFRNKCYYLGGYDTIEDAAQARREAEKQFFGKHIQ